MGISGQYYNYKLPYIAENRHRFSVWTLRENDYQKASPMAENLSTLQVSILYC